MMGNNRGRGGFLLRGILMRSCVTLCQGGGIQTTKESKYNNKTFNVLMYLDEANKISSPLPLPASLKSNCILIERLCIYRWASFGFKLSNILTFNPQEYTMLIKC